ncbi:sodium/potassium-transporting ATPase subunit beta [Paragonimus westermani]|uniref:Sodium/potassium-transporting ATPase subunit beta n=1 Tax=Paragonimus westermani TaxID=34504 RepID=A0A5J4NCV4_9TREM|nr:sodium/potassium-transporting ATPase subunit beta [Paragonimus westermani]
MYSIEDDQKKAFITEEKPKQKKKKKTPWYSYVFWTDDPKTNNIMGRSFVMWMKLWTYLFVMYIILLIIMTGLLIIILQLIVSNDVPYVTGMDSPLELSPGLGIRPRIDFRSALIAYAASDPQTYMPYVQNIRTFVYFYEEVNIKPQDGFATCENNIKSPDDLDLVCKFYPLDLGVCVKENNYGYDRSQPCVILKINNVYGWLPDIKNSSMTSNPLVRCHGQNPQDLENFGTVRYFPNVTIDGVTYGYFSNLYFPYLVQVAYRSPLVAVQFENPKRHVLLMVRCELYNLQRPGAPVDFELLVD